MFKQGWGLAQGGSNWGGDTAHYVKLSFRTLQLTQQVGGPLLQEIMSLRGCILQVGACQILSLAENPIWSPSVAISSDKMKVNTLLESEKGGEGYGYG